MCPGQNRNANAVDVLLDRRSDEHLRRLVQADAVRGRDVTSYPSIRRDLENAGARWIDAEVAADGGIITSRSPKDLPAFIAAVIDEIEGAKPGSATA